MRAALGLGANLGDPRVALTIAVAHIMADPWVVRLRRSSFYDTAPVGGPEQPDYLNAVVVVDLQTGQATEAAAEHLLELAHRIEEDLHRVRDVRWGPRTVDVDVLAVADLVTTDPRLTVPHPRATERAFVLIPWAEIDPDFVIPGVSTVATALAALSEHDKRDVRPAVVDR